MKLRALEIQRLPGVDALRVEPPGDGVQLIVGPNAAGKSSLVRALRLLLAEVRPDDPTTVALSAAFEADDGHWRVTRTGSARQWEHDGRPCDPPALPASTQLDAYLLRVEDLLAADSAHDTRLGQHLRRELWGGFDLEAVRTEPPFAMGPRVGRGEADAVRRTRTRLHEVLKGYEALRRQEKDLHTLERNIEEAREAQHRATRLEAALRLLEARRQRQQLEERIAAFPEAVARLDGAEAGRLDTLESRCAELQEQEREQRGRREQLREQLEATGMAERRPEEATLRALNDRLHELTRQREQLERDRDELRSAEAQVTGCLEGLGGPPDDPPAAPAVTPEAVSRAQTLAERAHRARRDYDEARGHEERAREDRTQGRTPGPGPFVEGGVGAAAAGATVLAVHAGAIPAALLAAVAALGAAALLAWRLYRARSAGASDDHVRHLAQRRADAEAELDRVAQARDELQRRCGVDVGQVTEGGLARLLQLAHDLDAARARRHRCQEAVEQRLERISALRDGLLRELGEWLDAAGGKDASDDHALRSHLQELEQRARTAADLHLKLLEVDREVARTRHEHDEAEREWRALFERAALEPGDRAALEELLRQRGEHQNLRQELDRALAVERERAGAVGDDAELTGMVEAGDEETLQRRLEQCRHAAESLTSHQEAYQRLKARLDQAGLDGELERVSAELQQAEDRLAAYRERALLAAAGHAVLDLVEREHRVDGEPEVLRTARERFNAFTDHAWGLELGDDGRFQGRELRSGEVRELRELSSGTRMQLLLAVRTAWLEYSERAHRALPLFLDEALTTTDEHRFRAVAGALERLAESSQRQVFYLTARPQEIRLWEAASGHRPAVIDLQELRRGEPTPAAADFELPAEDPLPAPEGRSASEYGSALDVPPVEPSRAAEDVHLFHLLRDDLETLYRLLVHKVVRLGELEAFLALPAAEAVLPDPDVRARLTHRCRVARRWLEAWRVGRGRPVDRGVLEQATADGKSILTDRMIGPVSELAEDCGGDGDALLERLENREVPGFLQRKAEDLREWLTAEGYVDPRARLDAGGRRRHVLDAEAGRADPEEINETVRWLEAGCAAGRDSSS